MKGPQGHAFKSALRTPWLAIAMAVVSNALCVPQAWSLALCISCVIKGPIGPMFYAQLGSFISFAAIRALAEAIAVRLGSAAAHHAKESIRRTVARQIAAWCPMDTTRPAPGELASLLASELELIDPFLTRYLPGTVRMRIMPLVLLGIISCWSWGLALCSARNQLAATAASNGSTMTAI